MSEQTKQTIAVTCTTKAVTISSFSKRTRKLTLYDNATYVQ